MRVLILSLKIYSEAVLKFKILFALALVSGVCQASEPIKNKDKFESEYLGCIQSGFANDCWVKVFSGHSIPWAKAEDRVLVNSAGAYKAWLEGQPVYKVHMGPKEVKGEVYDNRSYLLERDDGAVVGMWISFRQVRGQWYVSEILGSSTDEFIRSALGITRPHEK